MVLTIERELNPTSHKLPPIKIMDSVDDDGANVFTADVVVGSRYRSARPPFPEPGSSLGNDDNYFCLGRLGKGTFCSIHKCVDLSHSHSPSRSRKGDNDNGKRNENGRNGGG